ncbi:MAG: hypothetical protein JJ913_02125 [Rhizobiaceae bacterium]|nr:hypothetical protein [Rhizobiaceae bacterium]
MSYKLFLSSPSDVANERDAVRRVVDRINAEHGDDPPFELIRWEDWYYTAESTFQDQIDKPSTCDLVVCIFWKRLGSELPEAYRRSDGTLPTGTEYEFEEALQNAARSPGKVPDILVYRNRSEVFFAATTHEFENAQLQRFLTFWKRWFQSEQGHFVAAFQNYDAVNEFERLFELHLRQWLARRRGDVVWTSGSPFRGLKPFDVEHEPIFFGRSRETARIRARFLANAVSGIRFLTIAGASGSGKSSLARAGLLAQLIQPGGMGEIAGFARWAAVTPSSLSPDGREWADGLAQVFFTTLGPGLQEGDFGTPELLAAQIARGGSEAAAPIARALERMKASDTELARASGSLPGAFLLLTDQLEEVFAWERSDAERFLSFLEALARFSAPLFVIATLRSDFRHRIADYEPLARLAAIGEPQAPGEHDRVVDLASPSARDVGEMIVGPARAAGLRYEMRDGRDLQATIESETSTNSLPALQMLLSELYQRRDKDDLLLLSAYDQLGGVAGVMAARGEEVLDGLSVETRAAFPQLFRALIAWNASGGPAVSRTLMLDALQEGTPVHRLALALRDATLLSSDEGRLRIAHESLITGWQRLDDLFRDEQRLFEVRERLQAWQRKYEEVEPSATTARRERLLQGFQLQEGRDLVVKWGASTLETTAPGLAAFVAASHSHERTRRIRRVAVVVSFAAVVVALLGTAGWFGAAKLDAEHQASIRLNLGRAEAALRERRWVDAVIAAAAARRLEDNAETRSVLLTALSEHSPHLVSVIQPDGLATHWTGEASAAVLAKAGALVEMDATGIRETAVQPQQPGSPLIRELSGNQSGYLALRQDGALFALPRTVGDSRWTEIAPASGHWLSYDHQAELRVTPEGSLSAMADLAKGAVLRSCTIASPPSCQVERISGPAQVVAFSHDGARLAVVHADQGRPQLDILNATTRTVDASVTLSDEQPLNAYLSLAWSHTGDMLALGTRPGPSSSAVPEAGSIRIVHFDGGIRLGSKLDVGVPVTALAWSPEAEVIAYSCANNWICRAAAGDSEQFVPLRPLMGSDSPTTALRWSPGGDLLTSLHADGELRLWRHEPRNPVLDVVLSTGGTPLSAIAVYPPTGLVAAGDNEGAIWILPQGGGRERLAPAESTRTAVKHIAFSDNGDLAVARTGGTVEVRSGQNLENSRIVTSLGDVQRVAWVGNRVAASGSKDSFAVVSQSGDTRRIATESTADGLLGLPDGTLFASHVNGSIRKWNVESGDSEIVVTAERVADGTSGLSLSADPSGRWLTATRSDQALKLYDLSSRGRSVVLDIFSSGSKTVAFSPDGRRLALLGTEGQIYVWRFDAENGDSELIASVPAVPQTARARAEQAAPRPASWLQWLDADRLAIATAFGDVLLLNLNEAAWDDNLCAIALLDQPAATLGGNAAIPAEFERECARRN